jgi:hypothetical protein
MKPSRTFRKLGRQIEEAVGLEHSGTSVARKIGWVSAGVTVLALGVVVGRELRQRYKFNRRTPYDLYAHSGDRAQEVEFGLGI